jgi:hypothetical protein
MPGLDPLLGFKGTELACKVTCAVCIQKFKVRCLDTETTKIRTLLNNYYVVSFNDAEHSSVLRSHTTAGQLITKKVCNNNYNMAER